MYSLNKDYWFIIEPYTYTNVKNSEVILLNTLNGYLFRSRNKKFLELVSETQTEENLSVSLVKGGEFSDEEFFKIIKELRENFVIDIIDIALSDGKPIQFISRSNLIQENFSYREKLLANQKDQTLTYLNEVNIVINSPKGIRSTWPLLFDGQKKYEEIDNLDFDRIVRFCDKLLTTSVSKIKVVGVDIASHPKISELADYLSKTELSIELEVVGFEIDPILESNGLKKNIVIPGSMVNESFNQVKKALTCYRNEEFRFIIESESQLSTVDDLVSDFEALNFEVVPFFNGTNVSFFEQYVFMEEDDLCSISQEFKSIHGRQVLNTNDYGKLTITSDGCVYANPNFAPLGVMEDDLRELINKELSKGESWLRIRDMEPCSDCVYQWLCPSPSNYELALDKPNLCFVKP